MWISSSYSRQTFLPHAIQQHRRMHIPETIFRDLAELSRSHEPVHIHAGDALGFRRFDSERFAVEIQVEALGRAVASAYGIKSELLGEVTVRLGLVPVPKPVFAGNRDIQECRTQIDKRNV